MSALPVIATRPAPKHLELVLRAEVNITTDTSELAFIRRNLLCRYTSEDDMALANLVLTRSTPRMDLEVSGGRLGLDRNYLVGMNTDEEVEVTLVSELNYYAQEAEAQELFGF